MCSIRIVFLSFKGEDIGLVDNCYVKCIDLNEWFCNKVNLC